MNKMQHSSGHAHSDVSKWVKDLFKDEICVPDLGVSDRCLEVLNKLMFLNLESDKDVSELIKIDHHLSKFYSDQGDAITDLYNKNLPAFYAEPLQNVASIAVRLVLRQPTLTNLLLSLNCLENKSVYYLEESLGNEYSKSKYSKKNVDTMRKNSIIERKIEPLERTISKQEVLVPQNTEETKFLKIKSKEYSKRIKKQQKELKDLGFNPSLSHPELVKKAEEIKALEKEVLHLKSKVDKYQNLPPNEILVKLKVEELKARLVEKQEEFQELLKYS